MNKISIPIKNISIKNRKNVKKLDKFNYSLNTAHRNIIKYVHAKVG